METELLVRLNALVASFACVVLALCALFAAHKKICNAVRKVCDAYGRVDAVGRVVIAVCLCGLTYYGATKPAGFRRFAHSGGDDALQVICLSSGVSNDVVEVEGELVTNKLHMICVDYLGEATTDTPVSFRMSETNEWTEVVKIDPKITVDGGTNSLLFVVADDPSRVPYWWFGVDKPAIVVTEEGIEIREFWVTTRKVHLAWVCGETEATSFVIRRREQGKADWEDVASVPAQYGVVNRWTGNLFTVDKTYDWMIQTTIQEGE